MDPEDGGQTLQLHDIAKERAQKLEPRLSTLAITVSDVMKVRGLEIVRDGETVSDGSFNRALPIDGGAHKISARAPGYGEWSTTVRGWI